MSPVIDPDALANPSILLNPAATDFGKSQMGRWVSVGTLALLRVGDVWQNQQLASRPDYQLETFPHLQIDPETSTLVKAGLNKDDKGFLLPLPEHPWHRRGTHAYCIELSLPDGRRIIVPCMELIRFYFGSSSSLLTALFLPPLQRDTLYTQARFDSKTRQLVLKLAAQISGASASDIGRLYLCKEAWHAAMAIGTSILKASTAGHAIYPQCFFPFEGITSLTAAGKWLPGEGGPDRTFIVFNLRSCSHPFPFKSLKYETSDIRPRPILENTGGSAHPCGDTNRHRAVADSADQRLVEQDPSNQLQTRPRHLRAEHRFPDLTKKPVWRDQGLTTTSTSSGFSVGPGIPEAAIGEPSSNLRVRPTALSVAMSSPQPPPAFLMLLLQELQEMKDVTVTLLTASEQDGWTVPAPLIHDDEGVIDPKLFMDGEDGVNRLRRAAVFLVISHDLMHHHVSVEAYEPFVQVLPIHSGEEGCETSLMHAVRLYLDGLDLASEPLV